MSNNTNLANTTTQSEVCSICVTPFPETDDIKPNSKGLTLAFISHIFNNTIANNTLSTFVGPLLDLEQALQWPQWIYLYQLEI